MSGAILDPSTRDDCDAAARFVETAGCQTMRGYATIGMIMIAMERGLVMITIGDRDPYAHGFQSVQRSCDIVAVARGGNRVRPNL